MAKVLLVEDDPNQRKLYDLELTEEGYEVCAVPDGPSALDSLARRRPDAVVMDIALPGMDGLETLGRMLAVDDTVPVILNTAYAHHRNSFLSWAADAYVVKSSDIEPLKRTLREILSARAAEAPLVG
jgi:DNA-binding response OmpR family regulator